MRGRLIQLTRGEDDRLRIEPGDRVFVRAPADVGLQAVAVGE